MKLSGKLLIGASEVPASEGTMKALNPATNQLIEPDFALGGVAQVDRAANLADEAFDHYSHTSLAERSAFLERIADNLEAVSQELAARTALETGLPQAQFQGETARAASQFRQFAEVVRRGRFLQLAIDPAQPDRQPRPRMDHRLQKIAIGPVAVFGASNFPISYSVAGGDTASALAAGATVIVKALTPTLAPRKSRPAPSARPYRTADCRRVCSRWCAVAAMRSVKRWSTIH